MFGYILSYLFASSFFVEFDNNNCSTFLALGKNVVLSRRQDYTELMIMNNSDFQQYTLPTTDVYSFEWPSMKLNGFSMTPGYSKGGPINTTIDLVTFFCPIKFLSNVRDLASPPDPIIYNTTEEKITNLNCKWDDTSAVGLSALTAFVFISFYMGKFMPEQLSSLYRTIRRTPEELELESLNDYKVEEIQETTLNLTSPRRSISSVCSASHTI